MQDFVRGEAWHFSLQAQDILTSSIARWRLQSVLNMSSRCLDIIYGKQTNKQTNKL